LLVQPAFAQKKTAAQTGFDSLAKRAQAASEAGKTGEAIELYQQCLKLKPRWPDGWWALGTLYYDADRYQEAIPAFRNVVGLSPKMGPAYALLGLCEFETHDHKNSLIHLQKGRALGLRGNEELVNVTRYHEALLLNLVGEFDASMKLLGSLVGRGVLSDDVKVALGLALLRVPLLPSQVDPSKDALVHAAGEIGELTAQANFDQADVAFQQAIKDYPEAPFLHYAYGSMLSTLARFDEAEKQFQEEIKVTPDSPFPYMQLAYVYLRVDRSQDALDPARQAVKLAPHLFASHYLLGRALLELGNANQAVPELETSRRLEPLSPEVHYNLARAYAKVNRSEEARRERAEFTRLNAMAAREQQPSEGQSYRSSSDRGSIPPGGLSAPKPQK
jgi:predicted Zn-dependent protease